MFSKGFDRRWIFLAMGLVVFGFLKLPVHHTPQPSPESRGFFEAVEELPSGSIIFLSADYGPSTQAEILPAHVGIVYQALRRDVKVIAGATWVTGPPMIDRAFEDANRRLATEGIHKEYGVDFVNLGYKAGNDVAIANIGTSIIESYPKDYRGNPVETLPLMQGVENFEQIALMCDLSAGSPGVRQWLQQVQTRYNVRLVAGVTAVMAPDLYSFFQSKQLEGFLGGLVGAAEYEYLLGTPGPAMAGMTVQSLSHFLILGLIVLGNVLHFRRRWKGRATRRVEGK